MIKQFEAFKKEQVEFQKTTDDKINHMITGELRSKTIRTLQSRRVAGYGQDDFNAKSPTARMYTDSVFPDRSSRDDRKKFIEGTFKQI